MAGKIKVATVDGRRRVVLRGIDDSILVRSLKDPPARTQAGA